MRSEYNAIHPVRTKGVPAVRGGTLTQATPALPGEKNARLYARTRPARGPQGPEDGNHVHDDRDDDRLRRQRARPRRQLDGDLSPGRAGGLHRPHR